MTNPILKKSLIGIGVFCSLILFLLLAIFLYARSQPGQRLIRNQINQAIPGEIAWKDLRFSPLGRIELTQAAVSGPSGEKIVSVDRLLLALSIPALAGGTIAVEKAVLDHPQVWLETDESGDLNLIRAFIESGPEPEPIPPKQPSKGGFPADIQVNDFQMTGGFFQFKMISQSSNRKSDQITLGDIDVTVENGSLSQRTGRIALTMGSGEVDMGGATTRIDRFHVETSLANGRLNPLELDIQTNGPTLTVSGDVQHLFADPEADLRLDLDLDLADLQRMLRMDTVLSGRLQLTAAASGSPENPRANLTLAYGGGELAGIDIRRLDLESHMEDRRVTIQKLDLESVLGRIEADGDIDLQKAFKDGFLGASTDLDAVAYRLTLRGTDTALNQLPWTAEILAGDVRTRIELEGSGISPQTLTARADLDLSSENFAIQNVLSAIPVDLKGAANFADGKITVAPLDLDTRETLIRLNGNYDIFANALDMNLRVETPDLAQILDPLQVPGFSGKATLSADVSGPVLQLAVNADLQGEKVRFQDVAIGDVSLDAVLQKSGMVDIAALEVKNQGSHLAVKGTLHLFDNGFDHYVQTLPADLQLAFQDLKVRDFMETIDFQGSLTGNLDLAGRLLTPSAKLTLDGKTLAWGETRIGDLHTALALSDGAVDLQTATLENRRSKAAVSGRVNLFKSGTMELLPNPTFDLQLDRTTVYPADFTDAASGKLEVSARAGGSLKAPDATVDIKGQDLAAADTRVGNLDAELRFAEGDLTIQRMELRNRQSALNISGTAKILNPETLQPLENPAFDITIGDSALHLADFRDDLQGKLAIDGRVQGNLKKPAARLTLQGKGLAAQGNAIGNLDAELRFADGRLRLNPFQLENGDSRIEITGGARIFDPETMTLLEDPEFDLQVADGAIFLQDFVQGMTGRLALRGDLGGSLHHPKGTVTLKGGRLDLGAQKLDGVELESRLDGERFHMEPFLIAMAPGENIRTDGWISLQKRYDLRARTDGVSLNHIGPLQDQDFGDGKIAFRLAGKGSLEKPQMDGEINVFGVRINDETLQDLKLEMEIQDQVARITGKLNFDLDGRYHLDSKDFSVTARFDGTDLAPYFRLAGRKEFAGKITGTIEAAGNTDAPKKIRASTMLSRLAVFMKGTELARTRDFQASFEEGRITLPENRITLLENGYLDLQGNGNLDGALSFQAKGSIPVQVAEAFSEDLTGLAGDIDLSARLEGRLEKPDIQADIALKQVGMTVPELAQTLHDLSGRIRITQSGLILEDIRGKLDDGGFDIAGNVDLKNFQPTRARVTFSARTLPVQVPDTLNLLLNSDLTLEGTPDKSRLSGEVVLLDGLYYKDVKLNLLQKIGDIGERTRQESGPGESKPIDTPFLKNLTLDVAIRHRNPLMVDNNVALLSLKPELRIQGNLNQPLVSGRAEATDGTVFFQNTEFDVKKGVVDFVNPYKIEPTIDVQATSQVRSWSISLNISGTPENLNFKLSSNPPEEDADILSLLAIGKTTRELVGGGGGSSQSPKELLAGIVADRLQKDVKKSTGLDIVELGYKEGESGGDEIRVTVGKELSRRITVKYGMERRSGELVQKATTEYKLLENLLMSAFQDTEGDFGGELRYRLEFR